MIKIKAEEFAQHENINKGIYQSWKDQIKIDSFLRVRSSSLPSSVIVLKITRVTNISLEIHKFSKFMYFKIQALKPKPYPELSTMLIK